MGATRKTIKKVLRKKFDDFLESIEDVDVKNAIKKDAYITGGSIVSMLLGEKIKDYDIYFKTAKTTHMVAEYFLKKYKEQHSNPENLPEMFVRLKTNLDINTDEELDTKNIDYNNVKRVNVFIRSKGILESEELNEHKKNIIEEFDEVDSNSEDVLDIVSPKDKPKYRPIFISSNAITLSDKIQLVLRFFGEPEEVHLNYDFVSCTCYWEAHRNNLILPAAALESILSRTLYYQGSLYPICSVIRTRKFIKRGWHISAGQFLKMSFQISNLNLNDINVLEEQLTGVDQAYFSQIMSICKKEKEKNPDFQIEATWLGTVIDRIFC